MRAKMPEKYRDLKFSTAADGANGLFFVPSPKDHFKKLKVIVSDSEMFVPVKGMEGCYEISNKGRVKANRKTVPLPNGGGRDQEQCFLLHDKSGKYPRVKLQKDGEDLNKLVHVLVAEHFIPNPDRGVFTQVNHINGDPNCCAVYNLEWVTPEYNAFHAIEIGLRTGLKKKEILEIKALFAAGATSEAIELKFDRSRQTICDIKQGRHRSLEPEAPIRYQYGNIFWDHVSVSLPTRTPTWEEMCHVKDLFFELNETVVQFHPSIEEYVNNHPYCLHLWRSQTEIHELPPSILTGIK